MLLLPFRPITRGRLRRARQTSCVIALAALAVYGLTLTRCAFPGESGRWIAWSAGLDVREVSAHPVLCAIGHLIASVHMFSLPVRLNALAALAGALTVAWVYRIIAFFIFDTMREQSATVYSSRMAQFGGCTAALAVGLSLPFWQAATRFRPEILDIAILIGCAQLLTTYARTQHLRWLLLFGAVYGVGVAESPLLLATAPLMVVLAVVVEWRLFWCQMWRLEAAGGLAVATLVATHYLAAHAFAVAQGLPAGRRDVLRLVLVTLHGQFAAVKSMLPSHLWIPVLAMGVGFATLSILSSFRALDNRRSGSLVFLNACLTISAVLLLANVPFSPWAVVAARGGLPVATYVLAGMGIGLLAASWRALYVLADPVEDVDEREEDVAEEGDDSSVPAPAPPNRFAASRFAGYLLAPALATLVLIGGVVNGVRNAKDDGSFADRAADAVLDGLHGRRWVVGTGTLDPHLLIRARERGIPVLVLSPDRASERNYTAAVLRSVRQDPGFSGPARLRAESLVPYNFHVFIEDLFATDAEIGSKAVSIGIPDVWYGSGWTPVPERMFFGGVRDLALLKGRDLLGEHRVFWDSWAAFLKQRVASSSQMSSGIAHNELQHHLSFVANNLGVMLDDLGRPEEAFGAYQQARIADPDNISALLNEFELVSRGFHRELKDAVESELRRKVESNTQRYTYWALSRHYGYVRNSELFVRMGWTWAMSSTPGSVLAGLRSAYGMEQDADKRARLVAMMATLHEMRGEASQSAAEYRQAIAQNPRDTVAISGLVRLSLWQNVVGEARKILETGESAGAPKRLLRQDWAAVYLVSGDLPRARILLQEIADEPDANPMTLAMLAMVMIEQNDIRAVENNVLPKLNKAAGQGADAYFSLVVEGRIWQSKGRDGYRNARLCFLRAATVRPDVEALQEVILSLDVAMEDQPAAEARALLLLRRHPDHPYANFIIGSIRLEQGQYADAEMALRRSVSENSPSVEALNNFAQVLFRLHKFDEAERAARQATTRAPDRYEGWSTLACVLTLSGKLDEAGVALTKSRAINSTDPRLFIVEGLLAVKRGDRAAAERALNAIGSDESFALVDRRDLANLKTEITHLPN